jgi:hypothetical protein
VIAALSLSLSAIGRIAARWRAPLGELVGALAFGCFYPWHTPAWFLQCMVAGAFATWMVRLTSNGWAPAVFLGSAFMTHMTLPFLDWVGPVIALALAALHLRRTSGMLAT